MSIPLKPHILGSRDKKLVNQNTIIVGGKAHCSHHSAPCDLVDLGRATLNGKVILLLIKSRQALKSNHGTPEEAKLFQKEKKQGAKEKFIFFLKSRFRYCQELCMTHNPTTSWWQERFNNYSFYLKADVLNHSSKNTSQTGRGRSRWKVTKMCQLAHIISQQQSEEAASLPVVGLPSLDPTTIGRFHQYLLQMSPMF